jgi:Methyltransferase FkbM domain
MDTAGAKAALLDAVLANARVGKVDLVKMDVDGFECDVLGGAISMLERDRPIFVMELSFYVHVERGGSFERFLGYFRVLGYRFYDGRTDKLLPQKTGELEAMIGDGAGSMCARV